VFDTMCKDRFGPLVLRIALGWVLVYHGFLKIMAAGGTNWYPGIPTGWQLFIAWAEFASGLAILVGFRCRFFSALALSVTAGTVAWLQGWSWLRLPLRSLEPTIMLFLLALALILVGAGEFSVDSRNSGGLLRLKAGRK
jgi:uncharacterized membrane protein YphA (DoxX/SURF4 family)